jgi:isopenicillin N synthase-like dioxygenase
MSVTRGSRELPVLDLGRFEGDESSEAAATFVDELRRVVHEIGFFQLVGHGVDPVLGDRVHELARCFFDLPEPDRLEIENVNSPQFRGYTRFGHERTNGAVDLRDQIDIGREEPARDLRPDEPQWLRLRGPNQWPSALPALRPAVTEWIAELERVGHVLLRALALALGQRADVFADAVTPPEVLLKVIRYRTPADADPAGQGVGAHRDTGFLTFVVNIGEMFQLVTHGYFKATVHRVVSPPPGSDRISVAYFFNPRLEATLAPVELPADLAAAAPGGASADPANPILANYGDNSLKVRLRAHPDVAERHHADLLAAGTWSSG